MTAAAPVVTTKPADAERADGDIRYRPDIQGYSQAIRKRLRETEHQLNLLVTARARDCNTTAQELLPSTLHRGLERIEVVAGLYARGIVPSDDVRAEFVSLAATAVLCAEAVDRPGDLGGIRLMRSNVQKGLRVA